MRCGIAVELAKKGRAIFGGPIAQVRNEVFNLLSGGIPQVRSTAGIGGIGFHEIGIELMLADQNAEAIAKARVSILMTIVAGSGRGFLAARCGVGPRFPAEFLDGAKADSVCLPKSPINCPGLRHPHLGASNERGDVRGISVAVASKPKGS